MNHRYIQWFYFFILSIWLVRYDRIKWCALYMRFGVCACHSRFQPHRQIEAITVKRRQSVSFLPTIASHTVRPMWLRNGILLDVANGKWVPCVPRLNHKVPVESKPPYAHYARPTDLWRYPIRANLDQRQDLGFQSCNQNDQRKRQMGRTCEKPDSLPKEKRKLFKSCYPISV